MKKTLMTLCLCCLVAAGLHAQTLNIYKKDGTVLKIDLNDIERIDFGGLAGNGKVSYTPVPQGQTVKEEPKVADAPAAPANMKEYRGKNGKVYSFRVTGKASGRIWGGDNGVYTDDSEIAAAAVHAGVLRNGQTGIVYIEILPGRESYPTLSRNGITSTQFGKWDGSYRFVTR